MKYKDGDRVVILNIGEDDWYGKLDRQKAFIGKKFTITQYKRKSVYNPDNHELYIASDEPINCRDIHNASNFFLIDVSLKKCNPTLNTNIRVL